MQPEPITSEQLLGVLFKLRAAERRLAELVSALAFSLALIADSGASLFLLPVIPALLAVLLLQLQGALLRSALREVGLLSLGEKGARR